MNRWARMLAQLPATHQRLIARGGRISLPRGADAATRVERLRQALCRAAAVRATFAMLDEPAREAVRALQAARGGLRADELAARFGPIRSLRELAADPRPRSIAEQLLLLGWLLERPATPFHPTRWLLPPELRHWLPVPMQLGGPGDAPAAGFPPALRAAHAVLLACAARPLPLRADGQLRRCTSRLLAARLAPLCEDDATAVLRFVVPLLAALGLVSTYGDRCELVPAGQRFLASSLHEQRDRLIHAWIGRPDPDACLLAPLRDTAGINWPVLRRRFLVWAEALPTRQLLEPEAITPSLAATLGPLADAHTHGWRTVDRTPWQPRRAAAVFETALRGPLAWLGIVHWHARRVFRAPPSLPDQVAAPWRYGDGGLVIIPHISVDTGTLRLLPFAEWQAADAEATTYRLSQASVARATGQGGSVDALRDLLEQHAGSPPDWDVLKPPRSPLRIVERAVLIAGEPAVLAKAARAGNVRHALDSRLAPGVALVAPERVNRLVGALAQQGLVVEHGPPAAGAPPSELSPGECAVLLAACDHYRRHTPPDAPLQPSERLEARLRAGLSPALRAALEAGSGQGTPTDLIPADTTDERPALAAVLASLRQVIRARGIVAIAYDTAERGDARWRSVRPLALERHGVVWMLEAYCAARRANRTFRVDRIAAIRRE
jgi:hypothetical protein